MDYVFIYDNTFTGLLNLIVYLTNKKIKPYNIKNEYYSPSLFEKTIKLNVNNSNIHDYIIKKTTSPIYSTLYYIFLSSDPNKEPIIYYFYINAIKYKNKIFNMRNLKCVNKALKIVKYVKSETHKYKGFVRFKETNNILFAEISPENNVLELLSIHFKKRLKNEYWIIKDVKRNIYSFYNKKDFIIKNNIDLNLDIKKDNYQDLWKLFYNTVGIENRTNERCRRNFMPKKYWKYLVEMSDI